MDYFELHHFLKNLMASRAERLDLGGGRRLYNLDFHSRYSGILPGEAPGDCPVHGDIGAASDELVNETGAAAEILDLNDAQVPENRDFRYHVFHPGGEGRAREAILLFHGFNEKYWHKYLPWANHLAERTGKAVILFPIAFHMNRAPMAWSDRRLMHRVCERRKTAFPEVIGASLSNVAISTRLHARPQRFFWSGLQSYHDVVHLVEGIAAGDHPLVAPGARLDVVAYSIGCLLAQILVMTDPNGLFGQSRLCLFCGGAVFNRMSPVSRFILDSVSNVALYSYVVEHLESHLRDNARLRHFLGPDHPEGVNYRCMLNYGVMRKEREAHFRRIGRRLLGLALEKDAVIPPYEVMNALQGSARDLPAQVEVLDFPYPYTHEDPFPVLEDLRGPVDDAFRRTFDRAAAFLAAPLD